MTNTSTAYYVFTFAFVFTLAACVSPETQSTLPQPETKPASTFPQPTAPSTSDWTISVPDVNKMDGVTTQFVSTGGFAHIRLEFKNNKLCAGSCIPVALITPQAGHGCFIESNVEGSMYSRRVRVKFDDGKPRTEVWGISDDHEAIFPHNPEGFIQEMKKHNSVFIEFGCDASDSYVMEIGIHGLQSALDSILTSIPTTQHRIGKTSTCAANDIECLCGPSGPKTSECWANAVAREDSIKTNATAPQELPEPPI